MSTEPKRGTCGWKGKIDVNYDTSVHQKPHLKYHSCIDWRELESAPRVQQYENRIPCGNCGHVHLGRCPYCDDCPQIVPPAAETTMTAEQSEELDAMVRDFCKVGPRPKSEVRSRIKAYAAHVREAAQSEIDEMSTLLAMIANQVNQMAAVDGTSPVSDLKMIPMAISSLQASYSAAARARNGEAGPLLKLQAAKHAKDLETAERKLAELEKVLLALLAETCACSSADPNWHSSRCRMPKIEAALASLRAESKEG